MANFLKQPTVSAVGVVTHFDRLASVSGGGSSSVVTTHEARFRVDGKPFTMRGTHALANGDRVAVVGHQAGDAIRVFGLRNLTTGSSVSFGTVKKNYVYGAIGLGVVLLPVFGLGLIFLALGVNGLRGLSHQNKLLRLLDELSRGTSSAA